MSKLVRDKIPEIIEKSGAKAVWHNCSEVEYYSLLLAKLQEEVDELKAAGNNDEVIEELADIYEVLKALINYTDEDDGGWYNWLNKYSQKHNERGGFKEGIVLDEVIK